MSPEFDGTHSKSTETDMATMLRMAQDPSQYTEEYTLEQLYDLSGQLEKDLTIKQEEIDSAIHERNIMRVVRSGIINAIKMARDKNLE